MSRLLLAIFLYLSTTIAFANLPYYPLQYPRDEAAHYSNVPYKYKKLIEWWYVNGKLTTDNGRHFSYDIAFFNPAIKFGAIITKPFLHIQISDLDNQKSMGTKTDFLPFQTKVSSEKLDIVVDKDYLLQKQLRNGKEVYILKANAHNDKLSLKFDLVLEPITPVFLINENGLMPMPNNTNSYYYSIPHFKTSGTFKINNAHYTVSNEAGDSWMDHQWGDFSVNDNGWEWFSVRLENGLIGNIFLNVDYKNNSVISGIANIILPNGEKHFIDYKDFQVTRDNYWYDANTQINYPMTFNFYFPSLNLKLTNVAAFNEQEVHGYWEGYCKVSAIYNKQDINGFSYMEIVYG